MPSMARGPAKLRRARGANDISAETATSATYLSTDKKRPLLCDISTASRPLLFRMLEAVRFTDNVVPAPHSLDQLGEWGAKNLIE